MENYPETATERFDNANYHIKYCLSFIKKFIKGNILEIGAGCGSFTRNYLRPELKSVTLTDIDTKNISSLEEKFSNRENVKISKSQIINFKEKFDTILYLHVLEHIKNDEKELKLAE